LVSLSFVLSLTLSLSLLFGLQLEVRACARNFVVVSGELAWLRGLVASTASDFTAAGGPLADAAVLVHVLEFLVKATRFSERHWLGQESDAEAGGRGEEESTSEGGSWSEAEAEDAEEADAAKSEATADKDTRLILQWECDEKWRLGPMSTFSARLGWTRHFGNGF
jgi:hypothetical protein